MRLVATRRVEDGTVLGSDVLDGRPAAIPLLRKGVKLTARHRSALLAAGVHAIYVEDALSEGIEVRQAVNPETRRRATEAVSKAFDGAREAFATGRGVPESVISDLQKVAGDDRPGDIEECGDVARSRSPTWAPPTATPFSTRSTSRRSAC